MDQKDVGETELQALGLARARRSVYYVLVRD